MPKRRGAGEGSIFERADGRWAAKITIGRKPDGKVKSKTLYGKTRGEVSERLKKALRDQQVGFDIAPQRQTVSAYMDGWLEQVCKLKNRPSTVASYSWLVNSHIKPGIGSVVLEKLTPQHVRAFLAERHASGLSAASIKHLRAALRAALSHAEREGAVQRNVAKLVQVPRVERYKAQVLDPAQAKELLRVAQTSKLGLLFLIALTMGLRKGEALGLRWRDITFEDGTLRVNNALQRQKGRGLVLTAPKSEKAKRPLTMPLVVVDGLREQQKQQAITRQWAGKSWKELDFVFTNSTGGPVRAEELNSQLKVLLTAAKLPQIRLHDLRHSAATLLLSAGTHPKIVQETLGHSTFQLTMDTYSHVLPMMRNEVAERMNTLFGVSEGVSSDTSKVQ